MRVFSASCILIAGNKILSTNSLQESPNEYEA